MSQELIPDGVWPTMLTPFDEDASIDWAALEGLINWYIESGVAGLFTVCLSSEMYHLSDIERLDLAEAVVEYAAGRVPVVAAATFADSVEEKALFVRKMADTGVAATVLLVCQMAGEEESDDIWRERTEALLDLTSDLPLGLYETPSPYHRILSPDLIGWLASTGRFYFLKDTCADPDLIRRKLQAARDSELKLFDAATLTLLDSLRAGAAGYCSVDANFHPQLLAWLCDHFAENPQKAEWLNTRLCIANAVTTRKYPTSAKAFLNLLGLDIQPICRKQDVELEDLDMRKLRHLARLIEELGEALEL